MDAAPAHDRHKALPEWQLPQIQSKECSHGFGTTVAPLVDREQGLWMLYTEQMPAKHTRCKCALRIDADQSPVIHRQSAISKLRQERRTALRPLAVPLQPRSMLLQLLRRRRHLVGIGTTSESFISMMRTQYTISGNVG
eukprot:COSAG01_NODE_21328_length_907_cov_1.086634_1_plen_139_part_00